MKDNTTVTLGQKLLNLYLYSSLHIGLMALMFASFGFLIQGIVPNYYYVICLSMSTIALYSIHRIIGIKKVVKFENEGRFKVIKLYREHIVGYFIVSSIVCLFTFLYLPLKIQIILSASGVICLGYAVPYFKGKRIRDFNYIKIGLIALFWTFYCVLIPSIFMDNYSLTVLSYSVCSILFFLGITLPFDVRDIDIDDNLEVKTFATSWGEGYSMKMAHLFVILSAIIMVFHYVFIQPTVGALAWISVCMITIFVFQFYSRKIGDWYYSFVLDGLIGMFLAIYVIINYIINSLI